MIWIEGTCARFLDLICIWLSIDRSLCGLFVCCLVGLKKYGSLSVGIMLANLFFFVQFADDVGMEPDIAASQSQKH